MLSCGYFKSSEDNTKMITQEQTLDSSKMLIGGVKRKMGGIHTHIYER